MPCAWRVSSRSVGAVLDVELLARRALPLGRAGSLVLRLGRRALAQLLDGARDRLLGELAVQGEVGDDRRAAVKLDQHAGGAGLVDVGVA